MPGAPANCSLLSTLCCAATGATSPPPQHETAGFVRTFGVGVCRGRYAESLVKEWRAWDAERGSENDPIDVFPADQLYIVFVVADGGADLEHFEVHGFEEARSILLQVRLTQHDTMLSILQIYDVLSALL